MVMDSITSKKIMRCPWACSEIMVAYHDLEWGKPVHDDQKLFEFLVLEGAQAGLSWETILRKREAYRSAFAGFNPEQVAGFGEVDMNGLFKNTGIVRNRLKISSAIRNAGAFLRLKETEGSFQHYLWHWTGGRTIHNHHRQMKDIPTSTELSENISKDLRQRGFSFTGPVIIYAYLQAVGVVNDHLVDCFRHQQLLKNCG